MFPAVRGRAGRATFGEHGTLLAGFAPVAQGLLCRARPTQPSSMPVGSCGAGVSQELLFPASPGGADFAHPSCMHRVPDQFAQAAPVAVLKRRPLALAVVGQRHEPVRARRVRGGAVQPADPDRSQAQGVGEPS